MQWLVAAALAVLGGAALAWHGGLAGLLGLALAATLLPWLLRGAASGGPHTAGQALDDVVLTRVARATVRSLLRRLAHALEER